MPTYSLPLAALLSTVCAKAGVVEIKDDPYTYKQPQSEKRNLGFGGYISISIGRATPDYFSSYPSYSPSTDYYYTPTYTQDLGTYDDKYGQYTQYNTYYQRKEVLANLQDADYAHMYQTSRNPDYMTFDKYATFKKHDPEYNEYNQDKKVDTVYDVKDCGDCIRGNYIYCVKGPLFGAEFLNDDSKPTGVCCAKESLCGDYINNPEWSCSDKYTDNIYQYNICPMSHVKCGGDSWITVGQPTGSGEQITVTKNIRDLSQGETCTYRVKSVCGAPTFTTAPGGDWSSKLSNFNITGVEFEMESTDDFQVRNILSQYLDGVDLNQEKIENDLV